MTTTTSHVRTVHARVPKVSDVEIHVSEIDAGENGFFVDIREYIVSLEQYGRGVTFPWDRTNLEEIIAGLHQIEDPE